MDKKMWDRYMYTHTHTHTHTYIMEYYSAIKRNEIAICSNIDGPRGYYAKWNTSDKDKYCMISLICGILKTKQINITKQKQSYRYREQTRGCQSGGEQGEERNTWGRLRGTNFQLQNKWVTYRVGNIVKNYVISLYSDRWQLDLSWWSIWNV